MNEFSTALELEHCIGFSGKYSGCLSFHSRENDTFVHPVSKLLLVGNVNDPHQQSVCRGHDAPITCLDVSRSGKYMCSGQRGNSTKNNAGTVIVWNFQTKTAMYHLPGHRGGVLSVQFSADDKWVASVGADSKLCIWDMETGQLAGGLKDNAGLTTEPTWFCWGGMENMNTRRPKYTLLLGLEKELRICTWEFSIRAMSFTLSSSPCQTPLAGGGLCRYYTCGCSSPTGEYCIAGTKTGDVVVYSIVNAMYRNAVAVAKNGVMGVTFVDENTALVGAGDGKLKMIRGSDKQWGIVAEVSLVGGINNLTLSSDREEVLAGTTAGLLYRCLVSDISSFAVLESSHTEAITAVTFPNHRSDLVATCSKDGYIKQWDLSDYSQSSFFTFNKNVHSPVATLTATCIAYTHDDRSLLSGWSDGFIRSLNMDTEQATMEWNIVNAHNGPLAAVVSSPRYFCSAGQDGVLRMWSGANREMLCQISEHKKSITAIVVDNTNDGIIHTISTDKHLFTYDMMKQDIKTNSTAKKLAYHCDPTGPGLLCAAQRKDNEHELIVGTGDGRLLFYDIDYSDPTTTLSETNRVSIGSVVVSPSGRHFAVGVHDGSLQVFELNGAKQPVLTGQSQCHSAEIVCVRWSSDEKQLVTVGNDGAMCVWNFYDAL
eukprot:TRINITY_DN62095_c0_g1_i1.p1 TRINITY_DN62095_c0_g1~~TRINITY_DN62095_c0_g1_i1.p1  ORF type:complete len:654 (+),score=45.28 TRINITY_DN62095_c0_g1_i1:94-2055(+)